MLDRQSQADPTRRLDGIWSPVVDSLSKKRRSENMRRIRSTNTRPELVVRRLAHAMGHRFRLHRSDLPGKPDIVFPRLRKIIEVRGCFWHQHRGCIDSHIPKSRKHYWRPKLDRNVSRDKRNVRKLRRLGWRVLTVWECQANADRSGDLARKIKSFLDAH